MHAKSAKQLGDIINATRDDTWTKLRVWSPALPELPPAVVLNHRLKTTAGMARLMDYNVELCPALVFEHGEKFIAEILPHELGHIAAWLTHEDCGHGWAWHAAMQHLRIPYSRCHNFTNTLHTLRKHARIGA